MIEKINTNSINKKISTPSKNPQFGGLGDAILRGIQVCETNPMVNVAVLDLSTDIIPRTARETKTNIFAGFEAFRRESSGLIVNCLLPSFIVLGIAKLFEKVTMGNKTKMGSCWANEETINTVAHYWENAKGEGTSKVEDTIKTLLKDIHGKDGEVLKSFNDDSLVEKSVKLLAQAVNEKNPKAVKKLIKEAFGHITNQTHISENIKIGSKDGKYFSQNLSSVMRDIPKVLQELIENPQAKDLSWFKNSARRLVNTKSVLGLSIIIPLAISMQPLNRWITSKISGKKGAPIYKDFKEAEHKELTAEEKMKLFSGKIASVGAMIGVALLAMLKKPSLQMFQFSGLFPTMNQARLISASTFSSRIASSENEDELKESTVRDIGTFSGLYFLGDYASKITATIIEKTKGIKLLNYLSDKPDKSQGLIKKFLHWAKDTKLKSSHEVLEGAKNYRAICQLSNIGFSLLLLGIFIPFYTRGKTDKKHREDLKKAGVDNATIKKYYPNFMMNSANKVSSKKIYKAFFTSN
ncbi:MAG TPA: hypothetical protein PKI94_02225 [Candidatus Gastranaerophilaceae bacterium]|nr:hypothetical protein [Candidatus Gastranaerophilaceae bacterium]